ncbi:hypothetical protein ACFE04_026173 [Oxalis oulophora]
MSKFGFKIHVGGDEEHRFDSGNVDVRSHMLNNSEKDEAANVSQIATAHGPETEALRQSRGNRTRYSSDNDYELESNYLEDPTLNWSYTTEEDYISEDRDSDEVQSCGLDRRDDEEVLHTGETIRASNKVYYDPKNPCLCLKMVFKGPIQFRKALIEDSIENSTLFIYTKNTKKRS